MFADERTADKVRVTYTRMREVISIKDKEGRKIQQKVGYEWKPKFCDRCQKIGHRCNKERKPMAKQWRLKPDQ
ncbi:unnamed protein product [Lathyrus sativus]|nr:unnamed protein product [Lathyrus sativus]